MIIPFIDAHVHLNTTSHAKMMKALEYGVSFLSINTDIPFFPSLKEQERVILELQKKFPNQVLHVTSFHNSLPWGTPQWREDVLSQIKKGLDNGAVGVKIWKNIGMDLRTSTGDFIMVDDDHMDPIYDFMAQNNVLLIGHQGEPRNCWLPLDEMTVDSDRNYFASHPEYHMYLHSAFPSYERQMQTRDSMLEKHPSLRYVGLHLFSMEWSIEEVALRLDRYPNTMTDLAERICHLQLQAKENWNAVRDFCIKYQDRIIYGTDVIDDGSMEDRALNNRFEELWKFHYRFFASNEEMIAPEFKGVFKWGCNYPKK